MAKGADTRQRIIDVALARASVDGLRALTLGDLAGQAGMSKSGLYAHFGSKEALELAVVEEMTARFTREVWRPAAGEPAGRARAAALLERWLDWVDGHHLPGGCPIIAATAELDDRPGPARDHLRASQRSWLERVGKTLADAGARPSGQAAFELQGVVMAYSVASRLLGDPGARLRAEQAFERLLDTPGG